MSSLVRSFEALAARRRGTSLPEIARQLGVSKQGASFLIAKALEVEHCSKLAAELSPRLRNALAADFCEATPAAVKARYPVLAVLRRLPNVGKKTLAELQDWLVRHGESPIT